MTDSKPMQLLKQEASTLEALLKLNTSLDIDVKTIVLQELEYLNMAALTKPDISDCIPETVLYAVKSVLKKNLSLDPSAGLVYIKTRWVKVKNDQGQLVSKKALEIIDSANGIISVARQCGSVLDYKNPVVNKDAIGKVIGVSVDILLPSIPEPRWETRSFDESDFARWQRASHKDNAKGYYNLEAQYREGKKVPDNTTLNYANPNYTSWKGGLDPEFARAKAIRHGFTKLGTNQNEKRVNRIVVPNPIKVDIDPVMDAEAGRNETEYAEVVESTINSIQQTESETKLPSADQL